MNPFRSLLKRLVCRDLSRPPARSPLETGTSTPPYIVMNGVARTKEELEERVARYSEPLKQQSPRHTLKRIGYWAPAPHWSWAASHKDGQPPWPDIHRAVRPRWRSAEREQLVAYLRNGLRCSGALGFSACRFECRVTYSILGSGELTDGEWVWPEGLPHYVERHGVILPEEFVATASARGWRVPPADEVGHLVPFTLAYRAMRAMRSGDTALVAQIDKSIRENSCKVDHSVGIDYSVWLEWAKGLPEGPRAPLPPDPKVLKTFSLVVQYPDVDEPDEQLDGFDEHVWDRVGEQYGRHADNVGYERVIEGISVEYRDTVVAVVLEGLRRYDLLGRVKVICSVADPDDWQRNRDATLWPQGDTAELPAAADRGRHPGCGDDKAAGGAGG